MISTEKLEKMYEDAGKATNTAFTYEVDRYDKYSEAINSLDHAISKGASPDLHYVCGSKIHIGDSIPEIIALTGNGSNSENNANHIANCDPDTIRSIIKELIERRGRDAVL